MIVDVRTYTLIPRKMAKYLDLFEKHALPVMQRHGLELLGYYLSQIGPLNQVVHLWRYDSLADLEEKRAARDDDPAWGRLPSVESEIGLAEAYGSSVIALSLNTHTCTLEEAKKFQKQFESEFKLPVLLPVIEGVRHFIPQLKTI